MCLGLDHKTHDTILITDLIPPNLKTKLADAKEKAEKAIPEIYKLINETDLACNELQTNVTR